MAEPEIEPLDVYPRYGTRKRKPKRGIKGLLSRVVPRHTWLPFKSELKMARLRYRSRDAHTQFEGAHDLLVNLAPGDHALSGWVNVDSHARAGVDCVFDCRKQLPFPDASVRGIFTEHFVEHIDYTEEMPSFVSECHRVLQPKGVLRIIVPDAELYLRAYCEPGWESLERARPLEKGHFDPYTQCHYNTKMELINVVFRQGHQHKYAYDFDTLRFILERYGFSRVIRQSYSVSVDPELCIDRPVRESESLYVEAVKE